MAIKSLLHSSLSDNRFYRSMLVGNTAYIPFLSDFDLLESVALSGTQAEIEFTNLNTKYAAEYDHLQFRTQVKTNQSSGSALYANIIIRLNSDGGNNYSAHNMTGDGSTRASAGAGSLPYGLDFPGAGNSSSHYAPAIIDIIDPFETSKNTTLRGIAARFESNVLGLYSGAWYNTAAVSTVTFDIVQAASFLSGTTVNLYGLRK